MKSNVKFYDMTKETPEYVLSKIESELEILSGMLCFGVSLDDKQKKHLWNLWVKMGSLNYN